MSIDIIGHTDSNGSFDYNLDLSRRRSQTVTKQLIDFGVNSKRITSHYMGEGNPISSNGSSAGRAKNRRVEFVLMSGTAQLK
jgi:outer membrane protein OmpA-like peptidoglycan-associated protein